MESKAAIAMPADAKILSADWQGYDLVVWAIVETDNYFKKRVFYIAATGEVIPLEIWEKLYKGHIATLQKGGLVFHVFDGGV